MFDSNSLGWMVGLSFKNKGNQYLWIFFFRVSKKKTIDVHYVFVRNTMPPISPL
jgi:hypothetical protein